jgi:hypothetical protein
MKRYEIIFAFALLAFTAATATANAQYWFQSGARAVGNSDHNNGASVQIQTITPQSIVKGAMAFWVGETLSNGAFVQVGYTISNQTGNLSTDCTPSGCSGTTFIKAGDAEWFYEYFPPGNNDTFYGSTGPDGSAGLNGTFHTYSFYSLANNWYFMFDNKTLATINLGVSDSGPYTPTAIAEVANTTDASTHMIPVTFANLSAYKYDAFMPVQSGFGIINYGTGSLTNIKNPYGVQEIGTRTNYFQVGSGIPTTNNNTKLWTLGYRLTVMSLYGNLSSRNTYVAYTPQTIYAPQYINFTPDSRAAFTGWTGSGLGYYNGTQNRVTLLMTANITEKANWQVQYLVNVLSQYGETSGTGWYGNGSTVTYSVSNSSFVRNGQYLRFAGWSTGAKSPASESAVAGPENITAIWQYRSQLFGTNAYGQRVNVSLFLANNQQVNSTPFLGASAPTLISGAYYKGVWLSANTNVTQDSPETVQVPLPIYNVTVKTTDVLGFPVNASVSATFKNGTTEAFYTGTDGVLIIPNVPFGYANLTMRYLFLQENAVEKSGIPASNVFISVPNIAELAVLIAVFLYVADISIKREFGKGRGRQKQMQQKQAQKQQPRKVWSP